MLNCSRSRWTIRSLLRENAAGLPDVASCESEQPHQVLQHLTRLFYGIARMRILIADDNAQMRRLIRTMVEVSGWEVCAEAKNGVQAVTRAIECKPHAIILDLAMPEMNGIEAGRQISSILPDVAIVMFTSCASPLVQIKAARVGIQKVISKSDGPKLIRALEETLAQVHRKAA